MGYFNTYSNIEDCPVMVKDAIDFIVDIFGADCVKSMDESGTVAVVDYPRAEFTFKFSDINGEWFCLEVSEKNNRISESRYFDIALFREDLLTGYEDGFETEFGDIIQFIPNAKPVLTDTDDEEDSSSVDTVLISEQDSNISKEFSIVPCDIEKVRVVALRFGGRVIALRFKTDKGAYDMRIEVAAKYGLSGFKTEKFIALERVNGVLMSSTEKKLKTCVPDVSLCEKDCIKLINAMFRV